MGKSGSGGFASLEEECTRLDKAVREGRFKLSASQVPIQRVVDGKILVDMDSKEYPDFTQAVSKGAQLLDEVDPEWYLHIDTSSLDLDNQNMCVLGQTWNHYKVIDRALASSVSFEENNFNRYLAALKKLGKLGNNSHRGADYGFAFTENVYAWCHVEAARRVDAGIYPSIHSSDIPGKNHRSWDLDAEVWEHLTKTWLVLIEARQKAYKKHQEEQTEPIRLHFLRTGMAPAAALTTAQALVKKGLTINDINKETSNV